MKTMTHSDVQRVSLDILQELHNFCVAHDIKYSLGYGTLIGAIRHKGFIPWDDDVDVWMTRDHYDKFCALWKDSRGYSLRAPACHNTYLFYARLCEMRRTYVRPNTAWSTKQSGVWIDIFPMDRAPDDPAEQELRSAGSWALRRVQLRWRYAWTSQYRHGWKGALAHLYRLWVALTKGNIGLQGYVRNVDEWLRTPPNLEQSDYVADLSCPDGAVPSYPKADFSEYVLVPFEGREFLVMKGYDDVLRLQYGDYMQLPPLEQRVPLHNIHKYFWR